jgi:hypothetical protein
MNTKIEKEKFKKTKFLSYLINVKYTLNKLKIHNCKIKSQHYDNKLVEEFYLNILKKQIFSMIKKRYTEKIKQRLQLTE